MKSMTGYGNATQVLSNHEITVEIRSVNNRYFDCSVKLPRAYAFAEDAVKQAVKQGVSRGKIDVYVTINTPEGTDVKITVNRSVLEGYLSAFREICETYSIPDNTTVQSVSRLPDVFLVEKDKEDEERVLQDLLQVTAQAVEKYNIMRCNEGEALARDLSEKADGILSMVAEVERRMPEMVTAYRERLFAKMKETLESTTIDEARILQEAAIYADRVAVDEETVRLRSHIAQLKQMLLEDVPIGRKLDFLLQEMNRETNTIGSKCNDLELTRVVVDIKSELEKIREQIQNIE